MRIVAILLGAILSLVSLPRLAGAQSPATAIESLIDALATDSATGLGRIARDSTLVNFKGLTLARRGETIDSLTLVRIRDDAYVDCAGTDTPASRALRARCALGDFAEYVEIANFKPRGDTARADVTVSRLADQSRSPRRPWYRRLGDTLTGTFGGPEGNPPIWIATYSVTFLRSPDGRWATAMLRPWQPH